MRIFISWSGARSRAVAEALREWLPYVLPSAQPWMSATDIERGSRWGLEISEQLDKSSVGVICLTPESLDAPWILFEAGALSKALSRTLVCTYLFQVSAADVKGPLSQFQATLANRDDTKKLIASVNRACGPDVLPEERLNRMFDVWWPELDRKLGSVARDHKKDTVQHRSDREILEEILAQQRKTDLPTFLYDMANLLKDSGNFSEAVGKRSGLLQEAISGQTGRKIDSESSLVFDTRPLMGGRGRVLQVPFPLFGTVSDLLDELFGYVSAAVPVASFGKNWGLKETSTGKIFTKMGRRFARSKLGKDLDPRSLEEVGIQPGMQLEVISLREKP